MLSPAPSTTGPSGYMAATRGPAMNKGNLGPGMFEIVTFEAGWT